MRKSILELFLEVLGLNRNDQIGSGNFSRNFMTNRNTVLKLTVDKAYLSFVRNAQATHNMYLPQLVTDFGEICTLKTIS